MTEELAHGGFPKRNRGVAHWTRELRDGMLEFYMCSPGGQTCKGAAWPVTYRMLVVMFEKWANCSLPAPEVKQPRFRR